MSDKQEGTSDSAVGWLILGVAGFAVLALVWHFYQDNLKDTLRWIRWAEMYGVSFITGDKYVVTSMLDRQNYPLSEYKDLDVAQIPASELNGDIFKYWTKITFNPIKNYLVAIIGGMGMWALMFGPGSQHRQKFNLDGIINAQSKVFPAIQPFIKFNPSNMPPRPPGAPVPAELPPFAEALGPEEWIAYNEIPIPDGKLDEQAAYMAYAKQLGPRWQGPAKLAPYRQVLLAAFCLKAARKRTEADQMLGRLAMCWDSDKGLDLKKDSKLYREAITVLRNKTICGKTFAACNQHAFQNTALIRALETARSEGGVLAPAQFVWLRAHDRSLWYPLNSLGRQAYHMEALGAMSHYKLEKRTQRPIPRPKVEDAIQSITEYMASDRARPVPQLDYSAASSKRGVKKPSSAGVKKPKAAAKKPPKKKARKKA